MNSTTIDGNINFEHIHFVMKQRILHLFLLMLLGTTLSLAQTWKELGPCGSEKYGNRVASQGGTGQVHSIVYDPDNSAIVYCGSPYGGLWRSLDSGQNWSCAEIDVDQRLELSSVNDIAITKKKGTEKTIWIATGHPGARGGTDPYTCGLFYSKNGGKNFLPLSSFNDKLKFRLYHEKHISRIVAHPTNADVLFVATSEGLFKTTNGGKKWKLVLTENELPGSYEMSKGIFSVEFSVTNPDKVVYASGKDVYKSIKSGNRGSFKSMSNYGYDFFKTDLDCFQDVNFNIDVNKNAANTDVVYAACYAKGDTCGPYKRQIGSPLFYFNGTIWEKMSTLPGNAAPDPIRLKLASVPGQPQIIYAGVVTTGMSNDCGKTWITATSYNQPGHADIHAVEIVPGTKDMITGTDGGVFRYRFDKRKVEEYNNGLCVTAVIDMGTSNNNPDKIIIGNQDTGSDFWNGTIWKKLPTGGDGYPGQHIDAANDSRIFTCANFQFFESSDSQGTKLKPNNTCMDPPGVCPYIFEQHPIHTHIFYASIRELFRTSDSGKNWCRISDFRKKEGLYFNPEGHVISAIGMAPSDTNVVYVAYNAYPNGSNSFLFRTNTGGMKCGEKCNTPRGSDPWVQLNIPVIETGDSKENFFQNSYRSISGIAVSNTDANKLWICYTTRVASKLDFKVYKSADGGKNWFPDEDGLPDFSFNKIVYIKNSYDALFVASADGVYYKSGNEAWRKYGIGLPKVYVSDMEINYKSGKLRVSTYGRGVWETELPPFSP